MTHAAAGRTGSVAPWFTPVPPRPSLARVLACSWSARPTGRHRLVPDACVDVLWLSTDEIWLCGPEPRAWTFQLPSKVQAVGVRFRPGVAPAVLGFDAAAVLDRRVRWREIVGDDAERSLLRQLATAQSDGARIDVMEREVAARAPSAALLDPVAEAVIHHVVRDSQVRASALAAAVGLTTRQLHRRCLASFGYGASTLARIVRFHRFWSIAALAVPDTTLAALAHRAGYSDHAHLVRDCRAITGLPPGRFLAESFATFPDMSDPYKTGGEFSATLAG